MATPPTTTAETTGSSMPVPAAASSVPKRAAKSTPARPASAPEATKAPSTRRLTRMPASTAASGLEPIAYSSRPIRERASTTPTTTIAAIVISGRTGKPSELARCRG